jgi:hypothetical protein
VRAAPARPVRQVLSPIALRLPQVAAQRAAVSTGAARPTGITASTAAFPPIVTLANKLGTPGKIYSWTRRNVLSVPLWGATQGPDGCYETLQCSADDTSLLLAALLTAKGIKTRYVRGVVLLTPAQFRSAMGAYTSLGSALTMAARGGIPLAEVVNAKKVPVGVEIGSVWVEAFFSPAAGQKARWVGLDAYLKPLRFIAPVNLSKVSGASAAAIRKLAAGAKTDPSVPAITSLSGTALTAAFAGWQKKITAQEQAMARAGKTVGDFVGGLVPNVPATSAPAGPEGKVLAVASRTTALPTGDYDMVTVTVGPDITVTGPLAALSTQRLTVGYVPATDADATAIASNGGLYKTPPFTANVEPVVYLAGNPVATGQPTQIGFQELLTFGYTEPSGFTIPTVSHFLPVGGYADFGVSTGPVIGGELGAEAPAWQATLAHLATGAATTLERVIGEILTIHARQYFAAMDNSDLIAANQVNTRQVARPREMFMSYIPSFQFAADGTPVAINGSGMNMDLKDLSFSLGSATGSAAAEHAALLLIGMMSSRLEAVVFQAGEQTPAISTVSLLASSVTHGTPIAVVNRSTAATTPGKLALPAAIQQEIASDAASGFLVLATSKVVTSNQWSGAVWADISPTGFGYLIQGGLSGGSTTSQTAQIKMWADAVNSVGANAIERLEPTLEEGAAKNLAKTVPFLGEGVSLVQAWQDGADVARETGSPMKGLTAFGASFLVSEATGKVIDLEIAAAVAAAGGSAGVAALPAAALGATAVVLTVYDGDQISKKLIDQIKKSPIK